jgi:hypothetical protein
MYGEPNPRRKLFKQGGYKKKSKQFNLKHQHKKGGINLK